MIQASVREAEALQADLGTSPEERRERLRLRNGAQRKPEMAQSYPGRPVAGIIGGHRRARRQPATHAKPTDVQHDHRQHTEPPKPFPTAEPAPRKPDEMTAYDHVYKHGNSQYLAIHFGNPDTTLAEYDRWIIASPQDNRSRGRRPDLLIACNVSPEDYRASNGRSISDP